MGLGLETSPLRAGAMWRLASVPRLQARTAGGRFRKATPAFLLQIGPTQNQVPESRQESLDGSTAQKLDAILRIRSESGVTNLVVCIGPGNFQTEGTHDYVVGVGHLNKTKPSGFTVNRGWKIHGESMDRTILTLSDLYLGPVSTGKYLVGHLVSTPTIQTPTEWRSPI